MVDHLHQEDTETMCCMCGDVGFPDKLFSCIRCRFRFQHSYCSNYYSESGKERVEICDWCRSEAAGPTQPTIVLHSSTPTSASKQQAASSSRKTAAAGESRSEYVSGQRIKRPDQLAQPPAAAMSDKPAVRSPGGAPSPRQTTRRYKLLKDVMC